MRSVEAMKGGWLCAIPLRSLASLAGLEPTRLAPEASALSN
jgi:hypothetical protein